MVALGRLNADDPDRRIPFLQESTNATDRATSADGGKKIIDIDYQLFIAN